MIPLFLLALSLGAAPAAADSVYRHPQAKLTSHHAEAEPTSCVSYEGPRGHYLITSDDLYGLGWDLSDMQTRYNILRWDGDALSHQPHNRAPATRHALNDASSVAAIEGVLEQLIAKKGKKKAPDELRARITKSLARAARAESRRKAFAAAESLAPGSQKDPALIAGLKDRVAAVAAETQRVEDARVQVEPELDGLLAPGNPNPKASFYAGMGANLALREAELARIEASLDWLAAP